MLRRAQPGRAIQPGEVWDQHGYFATVQPRAEGPGSVAGLKMYGLGQFFDFGGSANTGVTVDTSQIGGVAAPTQDQLNTALNALPVNTPAENAADQTWEAALAAPFLAGSSTVSITWVTLGVIGVALLLFGVVAGKR